MMPRKKADDFTEVELEVMKILWDKGTSSCDEIRQSMGGDSKRKDSTVRTILAIMEKKGYVTHSTKGRTFMYSPAIPQEAAQRKTMRRMLNKVFDGSPTMLLQCLFDSTEMDKRTFEEMREMLGRTPGDEKNS
ncbi:MAG: hypothetical protein GF344_14845 [Chitinivibrionales bacterium]|nr:hypothetical protein [Chitinivibrionales bacterium]